MVPSPSPRASTLRAAVRTLARRARSEAALDRSLGVARTARESLRERAWRRSVGEVLRDGVSVSPAGTWGRPDASGTPLVMCLWNRPDRLEHVLAMLADLDPEQPVRLLLWNNQPADADRYRRVVDDFVPHGGLVSVDLWTSPTNFGGLARFMALRLLRNAGYEGPALFLDDDQDVSPSFAVDLLRDWRPRSIVAWWAFSQHGSYWSRAELAPGAEADHTGTGGTALDASIVDDDRFFSRLPRRFAFLEDQWMSFVGHQLGWRLVKGSTTIGLVSEELNQYHALRPLKDVFWAWQQGPGPAHWRAGSDVPRRRWHRGTVSAS